MSLEQRVDSLLLVFGKKFAPRCLRFPLKATVGNEAERRALRSQNTHNPAWVEETPRFSVEEPGSRGSPRSAPITAPRSRNGAQVAGSPCVSVETRNNFLLNLLILECEQHTQNALKIHILCNTVLPVCDLGVKKC